MKDGFIQVAAAVPLVRVADCAHNTSQIIHLIQTAAQQGIKVLCLPELCLTGASCGDLFLHTALLDEAEQGLTRILNETRGTDVVVAVGLPLRAGAEVYNCAALLHGGKLLGLVPKTHLSARESRWFSRPDRRDFFPAVARLELEPGEVGRECQQQTFPFRTPAGLTIGVEIGSDLYAPQPPSIQLALQGATLILHPTALPEGAGQAQHRRKLLEGQSARLLCGYVSAGAGEGESTAQHVYGGHCLIAEQGTQLAGSRLGSGMLVGEIDLERLAHARRRSQLFLSQPLSTPPFSAIPSLKEGHTILTRTISPTPFVPSDPPRLADRCREVLTIAALGLKQRLIHTGAKTVVIGLSGGLDSTLAALITVRALDLLGRPRTDLVAVTMPCFGTTSRTRGNAEWLAEELGAQLRVVDISAAVSQHFMDIQQDMSCQDVTFENAQARERTQVLMDVANQTDGLVVGTGDLSELALGWCTYNGDHMSMYAVNASIPKTLMRHLVAHEANGAGEALSVILEDILDTPVSPELLPPSEGEISQKTEELVGPYELHDFFLYHAIHRGCAPRKVLRLAEHAFTGFYDRGVILYWMRRFYSRFFSQQFKRACLPDSPTVGSVYLAGEGWQMPSDACVTLWMSQLDALSG